MRRGARIDANQPAIVKGLRKIPGVSVRHTHALGGGFPDLAVGYQGRTHLLEIKDPDKPPSKRKLTDDEQEFFNIWTGSVHVVETLADALAAIGVAGVVS